MSEAEVTVESEQFDESLQEDLDRLEYYAHGDYVEVEVTGVQRVSDDKIRVNFDPPAGGSFSRRMEIPVDPSYDTEFTRLLDSAGFNYSTASSIVGERVPFRYTDDGWEHVYTPYNGTVERLRYELSNTNVKKMFLAVALAGGLALFPVTGLFLFVEASESEENSYGDAAVAYLFGTAIWTMLVVLFLASP